MDQSISSNRSDATAQPTALAAPPASALSPGTRLREFELTGTLGEGGFSIVYAARDLRLGREVAIKEYIPSSLAGRDSGQSVRIRSEQHRDSFEAGLAGFINEARLLAQFKHPSLVEVLQFWEENGTAYLAMPRYSGRTLRQVLKAHPEFAQEARLRQTLAPVLDVLELLHSRSVFHRDVAPDNIIIQDDGTAVLLDLGSAREILGDREGAVTVVVKPGYAPLEQYSGEFALQQGPWTDVYAFGAMLYFALTGSPPPASISRVMKDTLQPLAARPRPGFSPAFLAGIDAALALQPAERPQSAAELKRMLGMDQAAQPSSHPPAAAAAFAGAAHSDEAITEIVSAEEMASIIDEVSRALDSASRSAEAVAGEATLDSPAPAACTPAGDPFETSTERVAEPDFADVADLVAGRLVGTTEDVRVVSESRLEARIDAAQDAPLKSRPGPIALLAATALVLSGCAVLAYALLSSTSPSEATAAGPEAQASRPSSQLPIAAAEVPPSRSMDTATAPALPTPEAGSDASVERAPVTARAPLLPWADLASHLPEESPTAPRASESELNPGAPSSAALDRPMASIDAAASPATPVAPPRARATPASGLQSVRVNLLPWGEIWVDGRKLGVSPPLREIQLAAGRHRLELRNASFDTHVVDIEVDASTPLHIEHRFVVRNDTSTP